MTPTRAHIEGYVSEEKHKEALDAKDREISDLEAENQKLIDERSKLEAYQQELEQRIKELEGK